MSQLVEILLYKLRVGTGAAFHQIMHDVSVPLHQEHGIDVIWYGPSADDPDGYGLMRVFADLETYKQSLAVFYETEAWRLGPRDSIIDCIETSTKIVAPMDAGTIAKLWAEGVPTNPATQNS